MAGIYIHIPFCKQACYYCDFHFSVSLKRKEEVLNSIIKELRLRKYELKNQVIETIYFGGGTPSLLSINEIDLIFQVIYNNYKVVSKPEITLEANPDDLSLEKIKELSKSPINRLSIGIQSFFNDDLKFMNRAHTASEAEDCLINASKYFKNITIDLIYGVPNMSNEKWLENLRKAFELEIPHISSYALTVEEKTALHSFIKKGKIPPIDERLALDHFNILVDETEKHGFVQYEISNFGKSEFFSKHNMSYWLGKNYLGIGPSAHSFNGVERSWNISNNARYIKSLNEDKLPSEIETLSINDKFNEYIMTGLRTVWGVSLDKIRSDFGVIFLNQFKENIGPFLEKELLIFNSMDQTIIISRKGKFLSDGIASDLFII